MTRVIDDPLYGVWEAMKQRCCNPKNHKYKNYGQRGITVSDLWKRSFKDFKKWAVTNGYHKGLTIDRINTNGNYDPSNCRGWNPIKAVTTPARKFRHAN